MEDLTGKQLGQYQLVAPLGEGGMAVVYKAYQPSTERFVALKILPRHLATEPDFVRRFKQEAKIIASLEHPNILPVYDYGETDGYTYIVMRFIEGGKTLADLMKEQQLSISQTSKIITKIADALDYAHSHGVIHRDIKPSNVLVDQQGNLLLSDFGLAKIFVSSEKLTNSGAFLGTPTYASPEQCLGRSDLDGRSDIYSLGVTLYEITTGRPPYDAETPMAVVIKQISDPLPLPRKLNPDLPESIELVILKALAKERGDRYQTAGEMANALTEAIALKAELPTTAPEPVKIPEPVNIPTPVNIPKPVNIPEPIKGSPTSPQKGRRVPTWAWAGGCLLILVLIVGATGIGLIAIPAFMVPDHSPASASTEIITTQPSLSSTPGQPARVATSVQSTKTSMLLQSTAPAQSVLTLQPGNFHVIFVEDFESYPQGILAEAPNTTWNRAEIGNLGNVTSYWVHSGQKNLQIDSFVDNTERDYEELKLDYQPAQLNIELWYTPDGYFSYKDFAQIGLSYVTSKSEMENIAYFWAVDHEVFFKASGIKEKMPVFNGLDYNRGPADLGQGTPKHNYIRAEFDFRNNMVRFYIGADKTAPLRNSINFDGSLKFNAFYIAGGLSPTYIDDIRIEAANAPK